MNYLPASIANLVEKAFNRYIGLSTTARLEMPALDGKSIQVVVRELNLGIVFNVDGGHVEVGYEPQENIDCTIEATTLALLRLAITSDGDESAFGSGFDMQGDMDTGKQFRDILKKVDIDWEEILSKYTGDVVAHKVGNGARMLAKWGKDSVDRLGQDLSEYLREESRQLPTQVEVDHYIQQVDELRLAVDRLDARIKKLMPGKNLNQDNADTGDGQA